MTNDIQISAKIAIHAHVFYEHLWFELKQCIQNIVNVCNAGRTTIFITYPSENQTLSSILKESADWVNTRLIPTCNRGYDVGPFILEFINKINLNDYDYIVKLHTKRDTNFWLNFKYFRDSDWRESLLSFCKTEAAFKQSLSALSNNPRIGMIASSKLINYACSDLPMYITEHQAAMKDLGLTMNLPVTVVGTMFMVRSKLMTPFQNRYSDNDFDVVTKETSHKTYGLAGRLEYHIPIAVSAQGYIICEGQFPWWLAYVGYIFMAYIYKTLRLTAEIAEATIGRDKLLALHKKLEK